MKDFHRTTPSALVNILIVLLMVVGLVGVSQVRVVDAALVVQPSASGYGNLEIVQGNLVRLSATMGEEISFSLEIKSPDASRNYTWVVLNPPAHGDVAIELSGQGTAGTFVPHPGYTGRDYFAIFVVDQLGNNVRIGVAVDILPVPTSGNQVPGDNEALSHLLAVDRLSRSQARLSSLNYKGTTLNSPSPFQDVETQGEMGEYFATKIVELPDGTLLETDVFHGPSAPPFDPSNNQVNLSTPEVTANSVLLSDVPRFTWVFGSGAVAAAMIAGYYDRNGFPDIYTGPTNGGVIPLTDTVWGTWVDGAGETYPNNPLVATRIGVDGRTTRGSIDDYWVQYLSDAPDPYLSNGWTEHTWGDAIGDYMYTSQSAWINLDGNTHFFGRSDSATAFSCNEIESFYSSEKDGTVGMRQFYEARGYDVGSCYFQFTDNMYPGGFNLDQFKAEIDAGFPVMIHLSGHSIVGVGYEPGTNTIYIHDAWINGVNTMEWGGSYQNMSMRAVSIVHPGLAVVPENDAITTPIQITTLPYEHTLDTSLATRASDDPDLDGCGLAAGKASVWYRYTSEADGMLDLDTFGSDYDTVIGVWSGAPGNLTEVTCNDDFDSRQSKVFLPVNGGVDYYIGVSEFKELLPTAIDVADISGKDAETSDISANKGGMLVLHASDTVTTIPLMDVAPLSDEVWGYRLMPLAEVTLIIGSYVTSRMSDEFGQVYFDLSGVMDIVPGNVITINDGYGSRVYTVALLAITRVRVTEDDVEGTSAVNNVYPIRVFACNDAYCVSVGAHSVVGTDDWWADFDDIPYDLSNGDLLTAVISDEAGNWTLVTWRLSDPHMLVDPQENSVYVFDWYVEEPDDLLFSHPLELRINGTLVDNCLTDLSMNCAFSDVPVDIIAGQLVEIRGDYKIIEHVVQKLKIKLIDPIADAVKGKATAGSIVLVTASEPSSETGEYVSVTANADGVWLADFSARVDIVPGSIVHAYAFDQAGNATFISGHVPVPSFSVDLDSNKVDGWDWTPGSLVTLTIGAYSRSITVDAYGRFSIDLAGILDFQSGQTVVVSDGLATKTLVVSNLSISGFDEVDEVISGIGNPDSPVLVVAFDDVSTGTGINLQTDTLGDWSADFSGLEEIGPGTWGWVEQEDGDGDLTVISFSLPEVPVLNSLGKPYAIAGQPAMTLLINGQNFEPASIVWWGGMEWETTFLNSTLLSITLNEADLAIPGDISVRVDTPPPGGGTSSILNFQVISVTPAYESKLNSNYVDFDWDEIDGATQYKIQLSSAKDFSVLLLNTKTVSLSFTTYDMPLVRGKTYYWRIRPFYGDVKGQWSAVLPFDSQDPLPAPGLGATGIDGYTVTLNWSEVNGAVKYKLQVAKDAEFTKIILNEPVFTTTKQFSLPEKLKTYYWRVRAVDEVRVKSPWSTTGTFTVPLN